MLLMSGIKFWKFPEIIFRWKTFIYPIPLYVSYLSIETAVSSSIYVDHK